MKKLKLHTLYKHKTNRDIAFEVVNYEEDGKALLFLYNTNSAKISNNSIRSCYCGNGTFKLRPIEEYINLEEKE